MRFLRRQFRDHPFRVALGAPLAVQPSAKRRDHADKVLNQIFLAIFGQGDDFNPAVLHAARQQLFEGVETEAGQTVLVFHPSAARSG
jgi:hypothetical protein